MNFLLTMSGRKILLINAENDVAPMEIQSKSLLKSWEKLLHLFHINLKVLEVTLFNMENYCIHVMKLYLRLYFCVFI